jgi:hypothetical protein
MNYWVVKGRDKRNDFGAWRPGPPGRWQTAKPPKDWRIGDRLFFWRSSPSLQVVGIGELTKTGARQPAGTNTTFDVRHLSPVLGHPIGKDELLKDPTFKDASFLKAGPSGTLFRLSQKQGERLFRLMCRTNPYIRKYWWRQKVEPGPQTEFSSAEVSRSEQLFEGAPAEVRLTRHERNASARRACLEYYGFSCFACAADLGAI